MTSEREKHLAQLLVEAQEGNQDAYREFLIGAAAYLRPFLARRLRPAEVVEEVVQETLMSLHGARHTYDPSKPVVPWMLAIAKCRLYDYLRRWIKVERMEISDGMSHDRLSCSTDGSEVTARLMVQEAFQQLPGRQREILELLKFDGLSTQEVSVKLQMTESAVRVAAHRAYEGLKKYFLSAVYENG